MKKDPFLSPSFLSSGTAVRLDISLASFPLMPPAFLGLVRRSIEPSLEELALGQVYFVPVL